MLTRKNYDKDGYYKVKVIIVGAGKVGRTLAKELGPSGITVNAIAPGVMGRTGVESFELIHSLCREISPSCVIAIDALAASSPCQD